MSKFKLAVFGKYPWKKLYKIPLFIFNKEGIFSKLYYMRNIVAQWVYPHLTALAYLRDCQTIFNIGAPLDELILKSDSEYDFGNIFGDGNENKIECKK